MSNADPACFSRYGLPALLVVVGCVLAPACRAESDAEMSRGLPSHDLWGDVLERFHRDGGLDYAGLKANRDGLDSYLSLLGDADPAEASREDRLAFWINAYNAVVARFVIDLYPDVPSVKDVDGFFDRRTFRVAGESLTLDGIERKALDLGEPRVHFAVVCASYSCPDLRHEAYVADRLEEQLEDQTRGFLADREKGARLDAGSNDLWLSSIFKWYAGDFTGGSTMVAFFVRSKVLEWVVPYLPEEVVEHLKAEDVSVRYLDYDWSLNDRPIS